jgi:hypothetical protein
MRKQTIKQSVIKLMDTKIREALDAEKVSLLLYKELIPLEQNPTGYLNYRQQIALAYIRAILPVNYIHRVAHVSLLPIIIKESTRCVLFEKFKSNNHNLKNQIK